MIEQMADEIMAAVSTDAGRSRDTIIEILERNLAKAALHNREPRIIKKMKTNHQIAAEAAEQQVTGWKAGSRISMNRRINPPWYMIHEQCCACRRIMWCNYFDIHHRCRMCIKKNAPPLPSVSEGTESSNGIATV